MLEEWVGKKAILQVKEDKSDGKLYSCAYVNLIEGSRPGAPEGCTNSTGVSASLETSDDDAEPSSTETESDATPSPTESEAEDTATPTGAASSKSAIGAAVVGGAAVVAALML